MWLIYYLTNTKTTMYMADVLKMLYETWKAHSVKSFGAGVSY